jgi:uncharacterized protein YutE (UPF0331/DUF86 family)
MIDVEMIQERLARLERFTEELTKYRELTREEFTNELTTQLAIERLLQLLTQIVIDIAAHIVSETSRNRPKDYEESIGMLGDVGVLPKPFAKSIKPMAGFRNILVHSYMEIDESKVYDNIQRALEDFPLFARYVHEWMEKQGLLKDNQ